MNTYDVRELRNAARMLKLSVYTRHAIPAVRTVRIDGRDLSTFDFDTAVTYSVMGDGPGISAIVDYDAFATAIKALPKTGAVEMSATADNGGCLVIGAARVPLFPVPEDVPALPVLTDAVKLAELDNLSGVAACAGKDDTLPALTTVQIVADEQTGTVTATATDRYRLATLREDAGAVGSGSVLVPARLIVALKGSPFTLESGTMERVGPLARITSGPVTITFRPCDSDFPRWNSLIPADCQQEVTVPVRELRETLKTLKTFSNRGRGRLITPVFSPEGVSVTDDGVELVRLPYVLDGFDTFGVNPEIMLGALEGITGDTVTLWQNGPSKPLLMTRGDGDARFRSLAMPVRIAS